MGKVIDFKPKDELVPIEEWDGDCWKTMFDTLAQMTPEKDPWDTFASFIKQALIDK